VPLFSVVLPTHGRPAFLAEAIDSVLTQTVGDLELIVVDDASERPAAVPDDARVRLVRRDTNGGPAAARNTGLDHATGRYLAFIDDDDLFVDERLAIALEGLARAPVAVCWNRYMDWPGREGRSLEGNVYDTILDGMAPHLGRTALVREVAPRFDERFRGAEDVDWWLRLAKDAEVTTVPRIGYLVRRHEGARQGYGAAERARARMRLLDLHAGYYRAHPRAAAFAWKRIGLLAQKAGDHRLARKAFARSFRIRPEPRTAAHLARSLRPSAGG